MNVTLNYTPAEIRLPRNGVFPYLPFGVGDPDPVKESGLNLFPNSLAQQLCISQTILLDWRHLHD